MLKHVNQTTFSTGIHTLYNTNSMHDSYFKQVTMKIQRLPAVKGQILSFSFDIAYTAVTNSKKNLFSFQDILQLPNTSEFIECINCQSSKIYLALKDEPKLKLLYEQS